MKVAHLTPGTGSFFCGSCLRDHTLVLALRELGHDVWMVPMYLPFVLEQEAPELDQRVWMGGINSFLQQKWSLFRKLPRFLSRWFDSPAVLRWASTKGDLTDIAGLSELTLSMLRGEGGKLEQQLEELVEGVAAESPDVVCLSNILMIGVARRLKDKLRRPVVCSLQGELPFVSLMPEPWRAQALAVIRDRARDVDSFIAVSRWYADQVIDKLGLAADRVHVVYNGIDLRTIEPSSQAEGERREGSPASTSSPDLSKRRPAIGFLARLCRDKGLPALVDAFILLKQRGRIAGLELRAAGVVLNADAAPLRELRRRIDEAGFGSDARFDANVTREQKHELLRSIDVLSVPATYGESFGLYLLEAWAHGVPCVQPRHAAFPELFEITGGGLLCEPDDAKSLADHLESLLLDRERACRMGARARDVVRSHFTSANMARNFATCLESLQRAPVAATVR